MDRHRDRIFQIVKSMYKSMSAIFWSNPVQGLGINMVTNYIVSSILYICCNFKFPYVTFYDIDTKTRLRWKKEFDFKEDTFI